MKVVVSCEHAGNHVPQGYKDRFSQRILDSHRGYDRGAKKVAQKIAKALKAPLIINEVSRLIVDANRAPHETRPIDDSAMQNYYWPHIKRLKKELAKEPVLHISVHTFTPTLKGVRRDVDIGLLYDPKTGERAIAQGWIRRLRKKTHLKVRANEPYTGYGFGLTPWLREQFSDYCGIEIELNQRLLRDGEFPKKIIDLLIATLPL